MTPMPITQRIHFPAHMARAHMELQPELHTITGDNLAFDLLPGKVFRIVSRLITYADDMSIKYIDLETEEVVRP
jgi:hypothetical protein